MGIAEIINFTQPITDSWLVDIVLWLVTICGSVWLGVILFTLLLKLVTLPFDFVSRSKMRKNSLLMEEMRPELEKLQKQYANNKQLYNQKMMALYKRNGYSMWGACLPTIITLVIFIVAINAFTDYSNYQNRQYFYEMSLSYNSVVYDGFEADGEYIVRQADGSLVFDNEKLFADEDGDIQIDANNSINVSKSVKNNNKIMRVDTNGYSQYEIIYTETDNAQQFHQISYNIIPDKLSVYQDVWANYVTSSLKDGETDFASLTTERKGEIASKFILDLQQTKAANTFRSANEKFLWVKNIWVTDSPMKHPIETDWATFKQTYQYVDSGYDKVTAQDYANLIAKLDVEKTQPNGYFILVALTALSSLFMQLITSKSQKAQMELQTVDGQGAATNKVMMWLLPIMMAVFAFMYTAAFSIYIVLSSLFSVGTTFLINAIVNKKFKKIQTAKATQVVRGRVYTPPVKEEKPKETKKKKKDEIPANDFLSGIAGKKKK